MRTIQKSLAALVYHMEHSRTHDEVDRKTVKEAADLIDALEAEIKRLRDELAKATQCITHANNSVYGSEGYFIYRDDPRDLSNKIEDLKTWSRKGAIAEAEIKRLLAKLEGK